MQSFQQRISEFVWENKYRYRIGHQIIDRTLEDTWARIAKAIAKAEKETQQKKVEQQFFDLLKEFKFLPGGRILAGAGTKHRVTLFNCFVMGTIEDSLDGIFSTLKESALTLQQGGGIGLDFSTLRPKGTFTETTNSVASGPVSFMRIFDSMSAIMQSTGARRGAMMGTLHCSHPDIEEFIGAKAKKSDLRHFNVSVLVTDQFLKAVHENRKWPLVFAGAVFRQIDARALWNKITENAYAHAEPGVLFIDTINRWNNLRDIEYITATNPCGEIPLPPYGACNLGSLNLTQFIKKPFTPDAEVNWTKLENTASLATRFLDNVTDVSGYPLGAQEKEARRTRRIGLGITGLADAFLMMRLKYGSAESCSLASALMKTISYAAWQTSIELASEKGSFPLFEKKAYLAGEFVKTLPAEIQRDIEKHGMRNSHHTTIAPAGSISLLANNVSSGLEPIFQASYQRVVRDAMDKTTTFDVADYAYLLWKNLSSDETLPAFVDAQTLLPHHHLDIQFAVQPYIDNAISKTIFISEQFPLDRVRDIYMKAYKMNLKGCTIFRPNPTTGSVMSAEKGTTHCCPIFLNP